MGFRDPVVNERFCMSYPINMGPKGGNVGTDLNSIGYNLVDDYGTHLLQCVLVKSSFRHQDYVILEAAGNAAATLRCKARIVYLATIILISLPSLSVF